MSKRTKKPNVTITTDDQASPALAAIADAAEQTPVMMRPPHYNALMHAGRKIKDGELVPVAAHEVAAHEAEGWERATAPTDKPATPEQTPKGRRS